MKNYIKIIILSLALVSQGCVALGIGLGVGAGLVFGGWAANKIVAPSSKPLATPVPNK